MATESMGKSIMTAEFKKLLLTGMICFCAGGLYGWSALISALQQAFPISTADAGFVFSIAIAAFTIAVLTTPYLPTFLRDFRGLSMLGVIASIWLFASSIAPNFTIFVIFFGIGFGTTSGAIYMVTLGIAAETKKPKITTPIMVAAFGLGGAAFGPIWRVLGAMEIGLLSILVLPIMFVLVSLISLFIFKEKDKTTDAVEQYFGEEAAIPQPFHLIALLWMLFACGSVSGLMVLGLASKMLDIAGSGIFLASIALSGIAIANTSGRLSVAGLNQISSPISIALFAALIGAIGLIIATQSESVELISLALILVALGYGAMASAVPSITSSFFGQKNFTRTFPIVFTAWGAAGLSAPWIAGAIFDATGNFSGAIYLALCANLCAVIIACILLKIRS